MLTQKYVNSLIHVFFIIIIIFWIYSGAYPPGCAAFAPVSPNVVADESVMKTDEGMTMEQRYTVVSVLASLSN